MAASVWHSLIEWASPAWRAEKLATPAASVALCLLGLMPEGQLVWPPKWWQLMQRIALRWIWVSHAQRLYGDKLSYEDPASLTHHIQSEFESRLHWDWDKMASKNAKTHNTTNKPQPSKTFAEKWGAVVGFDTEGKKMRLLLHYN